MTPPQLAGAIGVVLGGVAVVATSVRYYDSFILHAHGIWAGAFLVLAAAFTLAASGDVRNRYEHPILSLIWTA